MLKKAKKFLEGHTHIVKKSKMYSIDIMVRELAPIYCPKWNEEESDKKESDKKVIYAHTEF